MSRFVETYTVSGREYVVGTRVVVRRRGIPIPATIYRQVFALGGEVAVLLDPVPWSAFRRGGVTSVRPEDVESL